MYKVIIADDEAIMRKAMLKLIDWEALDCKVILAAEDGQAVIDYFETEKPDIIISDIRMPRIDGLKLAEYLSKFEPQIKLILLTAYADFSYAQQAIRFHVSEYVVKSGASDQIVAAIERCKKQLTDVNRSQQVQTISRDRLFRMIIEGTPYRNDPGLSAQIAALSDCNRYVLVQRIPYDSTVSDQTRFDLLRQAAEFLSDSLESYVDAQFSPDGIFQYFVLKELPPKQLEQDCLWAGNSFCCVIGTPFSVGISALCKKTSDLSLAAAQAREALEHSFYDTEPSIHFYTHKKDFSSDCVSFFSAQHTRLTDTLQLGASIPSLELLHEIFLFEETNHIRPDAVRQEGAQLLELCKSCVSSAGAYWSDVFPGNENQLHQAVKYCNQFSVFCTALQTLVEHSCSVIAKSREDHNDIVLLAQSYIHEHYQENLSLNDIAAVVKSNPSYLSRTFKARTGISIVDTITSCRMERAKVLLAAGHLRIQDVAEEVGMENTTYFSQVFRKYAGMSPKDYQKHLIRNADKN